jgi:hypothetical protein
MMVKSAPVKRGTFKKEAMKNYTFNIKLTQRHFPRYKIVKEPEIIIQVFYTDDYKYDSIMIGVGGGIIDKVASWSKVVREIETEARKVVHGLKPTTPPDYEDFENGYHDEILKDMHAIAEVDYNKE